MREAETEKWNNETVDRERIFLVKVIVRRKQEENLADGQHQETGRQLLGQEQGIRVRQIKLVTHCSKPSLQRQHRIMMMMKHMVKAYHATWF